MEYHSRFWRRLYPLDAAARHLVTPISLPSIAIREVRAHAAAGRGRSSSLRMQCPGTARRPQPRRARVDSSHVLRSTPTSKRPQPLSVTVS